MLPTTQADVYNNAKVRRRSHLKLMTQSMLSSSARRNCGSCGVGKMLALLMVVGLFYLSVLDSSAKTQTFKALHTFGLHGSDEKENLIAEKIQGKILDESSFRKPPQRPPRWKIFGGDHSLRLPSNNVLGTEETESVKQKTAEDLLWENRQIKVTEAFRHAWYGYKQFAMGKDELIPVGRSGTDGLGGLGATVVDALDTAIIMGLDDVVGEAGSWIEDELPSRIRTKGEVNLFETTIRVLGGLLSAYHLSGGGNQTNKDWDPKGNTQISGPKPEVYLESAKDLANCLMSAFTSSSTAIPYSDVVLSSQTAHPARFDGGASSTSEVTTVQLEFGYLSEVSGDPKYKVAAMRVLEHFRDLPKTEGLVPIYISPYSGQFQGVNIRLGSRGDSYYEYLLKVWLQQGGARSDAPSVSYLREMYDEAMEGVKHRLVQKSKPNGLVFVGELPNGEGGQFSPKMDHLVCFLAGNLALGATRGMTKQKAIENGSFNARDEENFQLAEDLLKTCYEMYSVTATGLAPEIAYFRMDGPYPVGMDGGNASAEYKEDIIIHVADRHNLLRPETVESLLILYRLTKDSKYREWGWKIFQAFESHTKVDSGGYSSLDDVTRVPAPKRDKMETFFLGETLKYLYLLFGDSSVLPLDKFVFNTEAHPLPIISVGHIQNQ